MATRTRMGAVDTMWLDMDRRNNLMVIESVVLLGGRADWDLLRAVVMERMLERYPVFGCRPETDLLGRSYWVQDDHFDLDLHLVPVTLPAPGDDRALEEYVEEQASRPLPHDRPMWELHLVDGYARGSALYSRCHHSLADGMALMQVLLSLTDPAPEDETAVDPDEQPPDDDGAQSGTSGLLSPLADLAAVPVGVAQHVLSPQAWRRDLTTAEQAVGVAAKLLLARKPASPVDGPPETAKRVLWSDPVPLAGLGEAAHRAGVTINDLLVAALAGALHTYVSQQHGTAVDIPTMVPVNLRDPAKPLPRALGNEFALVLLSLPSSLPTPFTRLAETKRRMDAIKHSPEPVITFATSWAIGNTRGAVESSLVDFFANKATGVTTNVIGPRKERYLAGVPVVGLLGWAPESGDQTISTCLITYAGTARVGFKVDAWKVTEPEELVTAFGEELAALERVAS